MRALFPKQKRAVSKSKRDSAKSEALLKARLFMNTEAALQYAKALWFAVKPKLRLEAAIELFRGDEVSLERAAEIAGLNQLVFHEILIKRNIKIVIEVDPAEELDKAIAPIMKDAK